MAGIYLKRKGMSLLMVLSCLGCCRADIIVFYEVGIEVFFGGGGERAPLGICLLHYYASKECTLSFLMTFVSIES
jgi:hypothetical protein